MRRRALNFAAILSVVLCVALLAIWLGVQKHPYVRPFEWSGRQWELRAARDGVELTDNPQVVSDNRIYRGMTASHQADLQNVQLLLPTLSGSPTITALWHKYEEDEDKVKAFSLKIRLSERHSASFPALMVMSLLPAAVWVVSRWRAEQARAKAGHCRVCGYDIRATPYRCPECGKSVSTWGN
jgi:hypothetical protein